MALDDSNRIERAGYVTKMTRKHICVKCSQAKLESSFFAPTNSKMWEASGGICLVCKDCISKIFDDMSREYDDRIATMYVCHMMDIAYVDSLYKSVTENLKKKYTFSVYLQRFKTSTYKNDSFEFSLKNDELCKNSERESGVALGDSRNQNFCISTLGYDPFIDSTFTEKDKKKAYNMLANYFEIPNIEDNPHSLQSAIQIVEAQVQIESLSDKINQILIHGSEDEEGDKCLSNYVTCRKNLQDSVVRLAESSKIAASKMGNDGASKNTLSVKMKQMLEDGVEEAQPNLFSIKWSEACKQVADISNRSIMEQLDFQENDYAEMVKKQREMITSQEYKLDSLEEENRVLKNQILRMGGEVE